MSEFEDILKNSSEFKNDKELERFLLKMEKLKVPAKKSKDNAWTELTDKIEQKKTLPKSRTIRITPLFYYAAAFVAVLISSWYIFNYFNNIVISVPNGITENIILPDNSNVMLNSGSSLEYKKWGFNKKRNVKLTGEAFFNITQGSKFKVLASGNSIEVLGTSFNVFLRDNIFSVKCVTGTVKIDIPEEKTVIIDEGKGIIYNSKTKEPEVININAEKATSWINGEYYFESVPVIDVLKEIERQFNVEVNYNNIDNRLYTGYFKNNNLESALENVCLPMSLHYEINEKNVKIW